MEPKRGKLMGQQITNFTKQTSNRTIMLRCQREFRWPYTTSIFTRDNKGRLKLDHLKGPKFKILFLTHHHRATLASFIASNVIDIRIFAFNLTFYWQISCDFKGKVNTKQNSAGGSSENLQNSKYYNHFRTIFD